MSSLGLLLPGVIILGLALWTTTDNNIYSSSLAFTNFGEVVNLKLSKTVWVIIAAAIALAAALSGFVDHFGAVLSFIGSFLPPFAGILIAHFWILHRDMTDLKVDEDLKFIPFITWIIAIIIAKMVTIFLPAIVGFVSAIIVYTILSLIFGRK